MQSSSCSSQPPKARRFEASRPTNNGAGRKSNAPALQKEDKNKNTIRAPASRQAAIKGPAAPTRTRLGVQPRVPLSQPKFRSQKQGTTISKTVKPKPKGAKVTGAGQKAPVTPPPPPLPNNLPLDPNCNEPSLPCLCCDGRSPQDHNSMFNHNHNNNNTISLRQQMQLPPPPAPLPQRVDGPGAQGQPPSKAQNQLENIRCPSDNLENQKKVAERDHPDNKENIKVEDDDDDDESSGDIDIDDDDDSDDEDDDTLVPSCCDCPPSLLEFSLSSSTSSSSTSISSCSDIESDCLDQSASICSSQDQENLCTALSPKDSVSHLPDCQPPARSLPSLPLGLNSFSRMSHSASSLSSPDEGYPSALDTPSPDYLGVKGGTEVKMGLLDFLESVGEFGKMERFSQIIQVARWDLDSEQQWDVLRDRLDHLDRLEKVNREVKLAYFARLHEKGFDLEEFEEQDLSDVMDEMGNIEIPWKFYKAHKGTMGDSQEFSDAGVDLTAPSDCDDQILPDSLSPSPVEPPPKPPVRHASVSSDLHTYINISRETTSMAVTTSPTLSTFSPNSTSPTFTTFRCEKPPTPPPPSIPPLPAAKPVPYLTLYTTPSPPPSLPTPTPPIPPPRRRHLARKEAQRLAALQAEQERTPLSLPPPTSRPPPLPPPPVISVSSSSPPAIPPPPALPPPPSFHALDVEIRKLLMLAGLTQAELLKLSPELGVCVDGLEDEGQGSMASGSLATQGFRIQSERSENGLNAILTEREGQKDKPEGGKPTDTAEEHGIKPEVKETQRTTSFTAMARRRKKNSGPVCDTYFSTGFSHTHEAEPKRINFDTFHYPTEVPDSPPPPPPPRPLPPVPSSVSAPKVSTLLANSKQPERFDWLIAFTPECEALPQLPPIEKRKSHVEAPKKLSTSSSPPESAPLSESAPKVTTFKELRFRNKSGSPPTKVITAPEPDPTVITPDPDILYNLKWRKEKACSDGIQWEYTSQAQALFMQPPPALTSMAALQEMLQRAEVEGRQPELCPQKIGSSVSDSSLWTMGREWPSGEVRKEEREEEKEEVRGRADGGRTLEMRTAVSSPPLSLAQSSQPYFLHTAFRPGYCPPRFPTTHRPYTHVGQDFKDKRPNTQQASRSSSVHTDVFSADLADIGVDSLLNHGELCYPEPKSLNHLPSYSKSKVTDSVSDSICNFDSLYDSESERLCDTLAEPGVAVSDTAPDPGSTTPYKNIEVMMKFPNSTRSAESVSSAKCGDHLNKARTFKDLPPLPSYYLYHPKNCPLHRGAPPRLSPIGALSPPHRSGAPSSGAAGPSLSSPLFPRSHTLPALAAPLYYPNLYPPIPPRAPPLPPKLYQAPLQSHVATVRSVSLAGLVQETQCMGDDVKHPVRAPSLSPQCLQEKRALVSSVSVAVEAIVAQFSSSRTVVQKTLSGDSTINPSLGRLVLQCLCPALHSLLTDGLKPHQSDLIAGRRPNSPWSLVQASTKPGPKTLLLFNLQARVSELPQLRQNKHRFNAFLLGLLNSKFLDSWLLHLQSCSDVLESFYLPTSFMRLSLSTCKPIFEELLLVLQPLSLLTFNLDLLFQHHHLESDSHVPEIPSPFSRESRLNPSMQAPQAKSQVSQFVESLSDVNFTSPCPKAANETPVNPKNEDTSTVTDSSTPPLKVLATVERTSPQLLWVQEKEMVGLLPPNIEEESFAQQAGQVFQQGWGAVMRWGGRLSQNLSELNLSPVKKEEIKAAQPDSDYSPVICGAAVPWGWGRLFGATKSPNSPTGPIPPTRRPSQWLAPGVNALTRMVSSSSTPALSRPFEPQGGSEAESEKEKLEKEDKPRPLRSVRTLCDHAGTGSELSFCKGEELVVLGGVNQDWIRCRQGDKEGLVPIGYTSLIM